MNLEIRVSRSEETFYTALLELRSASQQLLTLTFHSASSAILLYSSLAARKSIVGFFGICCDLGGYLIELGHLQLAQHNASAAW
jgi:hypothetical protein